jgi:hypothetical protein
MVDRRRFLATFSGMGFGSTLLPGVLWALADGKTEITEAMIEQAAAIADVPVPTEQRKTLLETLNERVKGYEEIYQLHIPNSVPPALIFDPVTPSTKFETEKLPMKISAAPAMATHGVPKNLEALCFATARELAELVRTKKVSSVALTQMYLERLKRYDPQLRFVITLTEERALTKAKEADRDLAAGKYRGPLHGLPWGAKDLLAVAGYRTTWGAGGFEEQKFDEDAAVVKRLDKAGAVLVAKLTLGALAMDDRWFGGQDTQSVESRSRIEWIIGGFGIRCRYGMRGICDRLGDARVDFFAEHAVRLHRIASNVRIGAADGSDGTFLEHGQAGSDLPECGRRGAGIGCDLWTRRQGPLGNQGRL